MTVHTELYDVLGISKNASPDEIKKAFRKKAIECHPDKHAGNKDKEAEFKKLNEAYSILSDQDKRRMYDQFGTVDDSQLGHGPGGVDINDLFSGMFGPGGGGGPGGFSFMFMNEDMGGGGPEFMQEFFGASSRRVKPSDMIEIPIDVCDLYYGKTKKVEFELLDQCGKCQGSGAADPSFVVKCMTCGGKGSTTQQVGPFFAQSIRCMSCGGSGSTIKNNKICQCCKGKKTVYTKRAFELKIPKGIPDGHETKMENKGAFDERLGFNKDMVFRFRREIKPPYSVDGDGNVTLTVPITLEELLVGFEKKINIYNESHVLKSEHYFNPDNPIKLDGMGLFNMRRSRSMDLTIRFTVQYSDSERLVKYNDVLRKVAKIDTTQVDGAHDEKQIIYITKKST